MRLGQQVMTRGIAERYAIDKDFANSVIRATVRFQNEDFGDISEEDKQTNQDALENGGMVMGAYGEEKDRIWIMRDPDGNGSYITTVLFPEEY